MDQTLISEIYPIMLRGTLVIFALGSMLSFAGATVDVLDSIDRAIDYIKSSPHEKVASIEGTDFFISDVEDKTIDGELLGKRFDEHNAPLGTWFTQWQVVDQGYWDLAWTPASGCQYTGHSSEPLKFTQGWSQATNWKVDAGFLFDIAKKFAIKIGAEVLKQFSKSESWQVTIPPNSVGQTWTQKRMVWQDQQKRRCVRRHYGPSGLKCQPWSEKIHGDLPDNTAYNTGVSLGADKVQC